MVSAKGLAYVTCNACNCQLFARSDQSDTLLRALLHDCERSERVVVLEQEPELHLDRMPERHDQVLVFLERPPNSEGVGGITLANNWGGPMSTGNSSNDNICQPYSNGSGNVFVSVLDNTNNNAAGANPGTSEQSSGVSVAFLPLS